MFDRLIDLFTGAIDRFKIFVVINEYEEGVVLTFGKYKGRVLKPGLHFIWPIADRVLSDTVVTATRGLDNQFLVTADDVSISISWCIRYHVRNIKTVLLDLEGQASHVLYDVSYGEIARRVRNLSAEEVNSDEFVKEVFKAIRRRGRKFGLEIDEVQITDFAKPKTYRLIGSVPT